MVAELPAKTMDEVSDFFRFTFTLNRVIYLLVMKRYQLTGCNHPAIRGWSDEHWVSG